MEQEILFCPDRTRENIRLLQLQLTPLETSLAEMDNQSQELICSCKEYFEFISDMLNDMYYNPIAYGFTPGKLEEFLDGKKINYYKRKQPAKLKELLSETDDGIYSYYRFLYEMAVRATINEDGMVILPDKSIDLETLFNSSLNPKKKNKNFLIDYDTRLTAFSRGGLFIEQLNGTIKVTNQKYPNMFIALRALADAVPKLKSFGLQGFYHCEFRMITSKHKPNFYDLLQPLSEKNKEIMRMLDSIASEDRMSASYNTFWKVNYKWKNRQVLQMCVTGKELSVWITGAVDEPQRKRLSEYIKGEEEDFVDFIQKNLRACTGCSYDHIGMMIHVFNKYRRVCSNSISIKKNNPEKEDIAYFKKFVDYRKKIILEEMNRTEI